MPEKKLSRSTNNRMFAGVAGGLAEYFNLDPVYALPKPSFRVTDLLFSNQPFGPYMSLDGVHPSAAGQSLLASAAVNAINAKYGLAIP